MKKTSISIFALQEKYGDEEALRISKNIGADGVDFDLSRYDINKENSIFAKSDEEIIAYFSHLKEVANSIGLEIFQTHGRGEGFKNDEEQHRSFLENARRDCLATSVLGAKICVMHSVTTIFMGPEFPPEKMRGLNFLMFSKVLEFAKKYNVVIATETFGDAVIYDCCDFFGQINEFIKSYNRISAVSNNSKYYKICVDTGHSNKAMRFGNPKPSDVIRLLGPNIVCLHLNDNDTFTDQHKTPMTGTIDWNDIFDALDEVHYDGIYNMEINPVHFGADFEIEELEFAIKVLKHTLKERYGD